jgi:hypothetical protein
MISLDLTDQVFYDLDRMSKVSQKGIACCSMQNAKGIKTQY